MPSPEKVVALLSGINDRSHQKILTSTEIFKSLKYKEIEYDNIIAIVPNIKECGVAYLKTETKQLETTSLAFPMLLDYLFHVKLINEDSEESLIVVVKIDGLNRENILKVNDLNSKIAYVFNAGQIYETGMKIIEMCEDCCIKVVKYNTYENNWDGENGGISCEELYKLTGIVGETNQISRNAALLAWKWAGL